MTEDNQTQNNQNQQPESQPQARLLNNYVKDFSFENVAMQNNEVVEGRPKFELNVAIAPKDLGEGVWEVALKLKIRAIYEEKTVFIVDIDHAGRFSLENVPENQRGPFLLIECPRLLYPFTRRIVSDITRDGGFLPLNIENIDFVKLYRDNLARMQAEQAKNADA